MADTDVVSGRQFSLAALLKWIGAIAVCFALLASLPFFGAAALLAVGARLLFGQFPSGRPSSPPRAVEVTAALGAGFGSGLLGPLSIVVPIAWAVLAARRSYVAMTLLALTSPVGPSSMWAVVSYIRGHAAITGVGLPRAEFFNIDPEYRCHHATSGCLVFGNEWLRDPPHNQVVTFLIRAFGPMPGAYTGPYPKRDEAVAAAKDAAPIDPTQFEQRTVIVNDESTPLSDDTAGRLASLYHDFERAHRSARVAATPAAPPPPPRAYLWQERCLLIWIPSEPPSHLSSPPLDLGAVVVIDRETGRCFAVFDHHSDLHSLTFTVNWGQDDD